MIITKSKPKEVVLRSLEDSKKVFIVGCGTCATLCQTGGEEQVEEMANFLRERSVGKVVVETPCDIRVLKRDLSPHFGIIESADAILALCCGSGAQAISEFTGKIVVPGLDTLFVGETERIGRFYERCRACGDCIIHETAGVCPIVRCAKGLLNGPCGGMANGKCEAGGHTRDCAWVLIYTRLKELGMLKEFMKVRTVRDWSKKAEPQELKTR
ncbi:MAG: methylenetetrahydrofolate reductase C-terminal domain-containing protein [Candidatus Methanomethylicia archaeon]|nr:methylenetetrahydrofolate reductase C-terminal domain-containing protein [Candidatus Methanomethylicia archaeon]MCQ5374581.1 methylenetetrahydrofolate reductase C-terminal domain-containing protein [Candidatus Methanomethylicia archaeon]NHV59874.1 5,10-methylenetetrahydrofolate reductase [Candidatus Verstraetearchaeota archaeon]